jgi:LacI family transcriptional regulator
MPVPNTSSYGTRIASLQNKLNQLNYYGVFGFWENTKQIPDTINRTMALGIDALISWDYHPCLDKERIPIALYEQQKEKYDCVIIDYHDYAIKMIDYIKQLNHQKVSIIGAAETKNTSCRFNYLCQQLPLHGIEIHSEWVNNAKRELNVGYEGFGNIIKKNEGATLIITPDDFIAEGVYYKAKELGVKIPEDMSIIGGDNMDICEFLTPKLNSFSINEDKLDSALIDLIIRRLNNPNSSHKSVSVTGSLMVRESCRKV